MDKTAPKYEIDVRLIDEMGNTFFVQVGGDEPIDPNWQVSYDNGVAERGELKGTDSAKSFQAARQMILSLKKIGFRKDLLPEYNAIINLLPLIDSSFTIDNSEGFDTDPFRTVYNDRHYIEIWRKPVKWYVPSALSGEHSGTVAKAISAGGYTYQIWSACNHGTCPGVSPMTKKCSKTFYNRAGFCQASPNCSTPLQWDQRDYWNDDYRHVCNDDSYIQYYRIKYNSNPSTSGGTCKDTSLRRYAPDCW